MFQKITYDELNARQKENYNFHKIAGRLAEFGFNCLRLLDDWQGADFLAVHINGDDFLKVQVKSRMTVDKKYCGKNVHIAFLRGADCFVYPHDAVLQLIIAGGFMKESSPLWAADGYRSWPRPPVWAFELLADYRI